MLKIIVLVSFILLSNVQRACSQCPLRLQDLEMLATLDEKGAYVLLSTKGYSQAENLKNMFWCDSKNATGTSDQLSIMQDVVFTTSSHVAQLEIIKILLSQYGQDKVEKIVEKDGTTYEYHHFSNNNYKAYYVDYYQSSIQTRQYVVGVSRK